MEKNRKENVKGLIRHKTRLGERNSSKSSGLKKGKRHANDDVKSASFGNSDI